MKPEKPADSYSVFEKLLSATQRQHFDLRLYVAGTTPRSTRAIENITRLCEAEMRGRYELEIIDVYQQPARAAQDQIVAVPTLVKQAPPPRRKLVGDLCHEQEVRRALGLLPSTEKDPPR